MFWILNISALQFRWKSYIFKLLKNIYQIIIFFIHNFMERCLKILELHTSVHYMFHILHRKFPLRFPHKNEVPLVFTSRCLFDELMSYLRYLCLFAYSGVQHILCCVFVLFFFVLGTLCFQFSLDCQFFVLALRYTLMFIPTVVQYLRRVYWLGKTYLIAELIC